MNSAGITQPITRTRPPPERCVVAGVDELPDGGDELPDVAEHEQPHDAQRDAGEPAVRENANLIVPDISSNIMIDFMGMGIS